MNEEKAVADFMVELTCVVAKYPTLEFLTDDDGVRAKIGTNVSPYFSNLADLQILTALSSPPASMKKHPPSELLKSTLKMLTVVVETICAMEGISMERTTMCLHHEGSNEEIGSATIEDILAVARSLC